MKPTTPLKDFHLSLTVLNFSHMPIYRYFILLLCILAGSNLMSQTAPDFTVTDSWGTTHKLYEDYLDQGKTVVLKIFYVACPPCNAIAPHLEPLYQDWGGGQGDVQFIELSILQSDADAQINVYKNTHHTTFPAAGGQGNSVPATVPYKNGTFGLWTGTPTFVVIAPDRTLQYDVFGFGIDGTIAALDAAIEATGAVGLGTATEDHAADIRVKLLSTVVTNELFLQVVQNSDLMISIINPLGQVCKEDKVYAFKHEPLNIDISSLSTGTWICHIADKEKGITASYLFVKN